MSPSPLAGAHFPRSLGEFQAWFSTDADCLDYLQGAVEVDETFIGGEEPGLRGARAKGKKGARRRRGRAPGDRGFGRCRMAPLADASADSLRGFLTDHVEEGARVITDGWRSYPPATADPGRRRQQGERGRITLDDDLDTT